MAKKTEEKRGLDPHKPFFLNVPEGYADGSLDPDNDREGSFESLEEAIDEASNSVSDHDGIVWVYECRPVRRVRRHSVVVEEIATA